MEPYLSIIEKELKAYRFGNSPQSLYEPIRYVLALGGKRLRPVLTLMTCHLFSEDFTQAINPALGIEVFHNFTLLHDDIMDNAPLRRGQPTVHEKWDSNTAILSGDVMMIKAYDFFVNSGLPGLGLMLNKFNRCATGVCEGQQFDMLFENTASVTEQEYIEMIRLKTAVLLAFSIELGGMIGGADKKICDLLYDYGINIGIGFQLKDDLLDVYADADKFGKQVGGDIISNKKTWLLIKALENAKGATLDQLKIWGAKKEFDPAEKVEAVKNIYDELQIKQLCEQKISIYFDKAAAEFELIPGNPERKYALQSLMNRLMKREN